LGQSEEVYKPSGKVYRRDEFRRSEARENGTIMSPIQHPSPMPSPRSRALAYPRLAPRLKKKSEKSQKKLPKSHHSIQPDQLLAPERERQKAQEGTQKSPSDCVWVEFATSQPKHNQQELRDVGYEDNLQQELPQQHSLPLQNQPRLMTIQENLPPSHLLIWPKELRDVGYEDRLQQELPQQHMLPLQNQPRLNTVQKNLPPSHLLIGPQDLLDVGYEDRLQQELPQHHMLPLQNPQGQGQAVFGLLKPDEKER